MIITEAIALHLVLDPMSVFYQCVPRSTSTPTKGETMESVKPQEVMEKEAAMKAGAGGVPGLNKAIQPTIGRVVYYFAKDAAAANGIEIYDYSKPLDAHVVYVWSDTCVNLVVFGHDGKQHIRTSVPINAGGAEAGHSAWAEWMSYQIGQAAKHAAA